MKTFILLISLAILVIAVSVGYTQTPVKPTPNKPTPTTPGQKPGTITTPVTPGQKPVTPIGQRTEGQPAQPVAGSAQLPPGTALLELRGTRGQGVNVMADERLMTGTQGTIDFWVAAQWDPARLAQDQPPLTVVKLGSTSKNAWGIFITPDKGTIGLWNGEAQEEWPFNFADGALHHVALATNERGTELFIDGRTKGARPISYGNPGEGVELPMTIGPAPFVGRIGGVRIWKTRLSAEVLKRLKDTPSSGIEGQAESSKLVGFLGGTGAAARFNMLTASFNIEGGWMKGGAVVDELLGQSDFIYKPVQLVTILLLPENHGLVRLGGASPTASATALAGKPTAGGNKVPVLLLDDPASGKLVVRALQVSGRNQYSAGTLALKLIDNGRLQIGQTVYRRADTAVKKKTTNEGYDPTKEIGITPRSIQFSERGYHLPKLNPWDYRDTGVPPRKIFTLVKPDSSDSTTIDGLKIPRGLVHNPKSWNKGIGQSNAYTNTSEYYDAVTNGVGFTGSAEAAVKGFGGGVGFSLHTKFQEAISGMQSERRAHRFQGRECRKYSLVLDKANATLSDDFRQAVESLKRSGNYSQFVESWGTHYPHAVGYGAKGVKDIWISESAVSNSKMSAQEIAAAVNAQFSTPIVGGSAEVSVESRTEKKRGTGSTKEFEMQEEVSVGYSGPMDGLNCASPDEVTPIRLDLRTLDELLTPPFFDDPEILTRVRDGLKQAIAKTLADANASLARFLSKQTTFALRPKQTKQPAAAAGAQPQKSLAVSMKYGFKLTSGGGQYLSTGKRSQGYWYATYSGEAQVHNFSGIAPLKSGDTVKIIITKADPNYPEYKYLMAPKSGNNCYYSYNNGDYEDWIVWKGESGLNTGELINYDEKIVLENKAWRGKFLRPENNWLSVGTSYKWMIERY